MNRIEFVAESISTHPVNLVNPVRHFWSGLRLLLGLCRRCLSFNFAVAATRIEGFISVSVGWHSRLLAVGTSCLRGR